MGGYGVSLSSSAVSQLEANVSIVDGGRNHLGWQSLALRRRGIVQEAIETAAGGLSFQAGNSSIVVQLDHLRLRFAQLVRRRRELHGEGARLIRRETGYQLSFIDSGGPN